METRKCEICEAGFLIMTGRQRKKRYCSKSCRIIGLKMRAPRSCSVDQCAVPLSRAGFCATHYMRWWKYGDPLANAKDMRPWQVRFEEKVRKDDSGCWLWTGPVQLSGYGQGPQTDSGEVLTHRIAYELWNGPITTGLWVCHKCDVPACVNPDHLFLGTNIDNIGDMVNKGRNTRHEAHPKAKLTWDQVNAIRAEYVPHRVGHGVTSIAERYGVSPSNVSAIVNYKIWRPDV